MAKINWMKIAGVALPVASMAIAAVTSIVEGKKLDDKVTEKVAEALAKQAKES